MYRQAWEIARRALGRDHPVTTDSAVGMALVLLEERKFSAVAPIAREVMELDGGRRPDHWERFMAESILGASLLGEKKYSEAERWLLAGYRGIEARKDKLDASDRYRTGRVRGWIEKLYREWGKREEARAWGSAGAEE